MGINILLSDSSGDVDKSSAANGADPVLKRQYQQINAIIVGVRIEGDALVDKYRKRWVYVYCFHCKRGHRKVRLDSLTRPAKVGSDGKLRKAATSCGCLAKKAHKRNMAMMAEHVSFGKKLKIWTQMKLGTPTATVAEEFRMNPYLVGHVTREIRGLAQALKRESHVAGWWRMCTLVHDALEERDELAELSFHRKGRKWVSHMESQFKRAQKILKKWSYFAKSPVTEVREILDIAAWVVGAHKAGMNRLKRRFKKRLTKADIQANLINKDWGLMLERMNAERVPASEMAAIVAQYARNAEGQTLPTVRVSRRKK
jgi:hypothetical protein